VTFTKDMPLRVTKETFLVNDGKKQRFTILLKRTFNVNGIEVEDDEEKF